jgi:hypothetical protein
LLLAAGLLVPALWACPAQALPRILPYVQVTVTPNPLDLGVVESPGAFDSSSQLKIHLTANCNTGGIVISMTPLARVGGGGTLPLERIFVQTPLSGGFIAMTAPLWVAPASGPIVADYLLRFRLQTVFDDLGGTYTGTLTVTYMPAP